MCQILRQSVSLSDQNRNLEHQDQQMQMVTNGAEDAARSSHLHFFLGNQPGDTLRPPLTVALERSLVLPIPRTLPILLLKPSPRVICLRVHGGEGELLLFHQPHRATAAIRCRLRRVLPHRCLRLRVLAITAQGAYRLPTRVYLLQVGEHGKLLRNPNPGPILRMSSVSILRSNHYIVH